MQPEGHCTLFMAPYKRLNHDVSSIRVDFGRNNSGGKVNHLESWFANAIWTSAYKPALSCTAIWGVIDSKWLEWCVMHPGWCPWCEIIRGGRVSRKGLSGNSGTLWLKWSTCFAMFCLFGSL